MKLNNTLKNVQKLSKIFQPLNIIPKNAIIKKLEPTSLSQRLMLDTGIIRHAYPGCFHYLPLGLRSLEKLIDIVDFELEKIGGQKISTPTLTNAELWKKTDRLQNDELISLKDRHNKLYVLSPTYEEAVTDLVSSIFPISFKHFPLYLYQIGNKFRDEIKPRFGLIRAREFIMKDLYTFDINIENAEKTYEIVNKCYENIFNKIGVDYVKVLADSGIMGGNLSHEFHYLSEIGEDTMLFCTDCKYSANIEVCGQEKCPSCDSKNVEILTGIEVGHTFLLGDKYSSKLKANYLTSQHKPATLQMGCFGLGLSRIIASAVEVLSDENEIRWPLSIAPFKLILIPPKEGSKESIITNQVARNIETILSNEPLLHNDILLDDRVNLTIGKRLFEARRMGYPFILVIGDSAIQNPPIFEIHDLIRNERHNLSQDQLISYLREKLVNTKAKKNIKIYT